MQSLALQCMEMLVPKHGSTFQSIHKSLIIYFTDLETADNCIDWHVTLHGRLLPTLKFTPHPLQCYNCHHMGHIAHYSRTKLSCGLCSEEPDTQKCRLEWEPRHADPLAPLTCSLCHGHHADSTTPAQFTRLGFMATGKGSRMLVLSVQLNSPPLWESQLC